MPTVLRSGPYRFYFVSHDLHEPPHVHVDRDDDSAKFWLAPVALASNLGFTTVELRRIQRLVVEHEPRLLEAWDEYFGGSSGRACEGRAIYRGRPDRRSAGRPHHLSAARVIPPSPLVYSPVCALLGRRRQETGEP